MSQNNLFQTTEPADLTLLAIAENTQKVVEEVRRRYNFACGYCQVTEISDRNGKYYRGTTTLHQYTTAII